MSPSHHVVSYGKLMLCIIWQNGFFIVNFLMLFLSDSNFQIVYLKKEKSTNMIQYESHIHDSASCTQQTPCENKSAAAIFCLSDACKEQL